MKKIFILVVFAFAALLTACTDSDDTLKIGINFFPMPEITELIKDDLAADGIILETVQMDFNLLNAPLANGEIDGNLIQHQYFMQFFNNANDTELVIAQPVYHSIFALYSGVYDEVNEIENGVTVYIPEDVVNISRALLLLESAGLITLAEGKTTNSTLDDIVSNPKNLVFEPKSLGTTPLFYRDNGKYLAVMYPSFARSAIGLEDDSEFLFAEELNALTETYAISFVTRADNLNDPKIQKFIEHLTSEKVRTWLEENYGWAAIPAF